MTHTCHAEREPRVNHTPEVERENWLAQKLGVGKGEE